MISVDLAEQLAAAGLVWHPARGDHFVLPHRDMDGDVFVLSDMTIEVHRFAQGEVLGFNGTVEWALDSVEFHEALWMPREDQLRDALGAAFEGLRRTGDGYECRAEKVTGYGQTAAEAYARALLDLLRDHEHAQVAIP
ncbi:MAG: hypothetical protein WCA29_04605 [Jiangellales bacterium]